jgi:hypothetical protein
MNRLLTLPPRVCQRLLTLLLVGGLVVGCTAGRDGPGAVTYTGEIEAYLEPFDQKNACSVTMVLHNLSQVRQGDANLTLAWFDASGVLLAEQSLRMDGLLEGRADAKNLTLPVLCKQVDRVLVRSAKWNLFMGWGTPGPIVRIDGVEGVELRLDWNAQTGLFESIKGNSK